MVAPLFLGGLTCMPWSTLGGAIVPFCRDSRSGKFSFDGATLAGGGGEPFGGATGTVGLAGGGACAAAGALSINMISENVRNMGRPSFPSRPPDIRRTPCRSPWVRFAYTPRPALRLVTTFKQGPRSH
jgi:hypothetical protein